MINGELIVDNFAGGGGASTGIELATGYSPDIAINHDPEAIRMHRTNHPNTKHYCESVWDVDPIKACGGHPVGLAWFSPDCFKAGTLILTEDGYKPIEDIRVGERVLTHKKRWRKVTATMRTERDEMVVKGYGHPGLVCSTGHPFYVKTRAEIWNNKTREYNHRYSAPTWKKARELSKNDYWGCPVTFESLPIPTIEKKNNRDVTFPIDECLLWLAGRYVGRGWTKLTKSQAEIVIVCDCHETEHLRKKLDMWKRKSFQCEDQEVEWSYREGNTSGQFTCNNRNLVQWLHDNFGMLAPRKKIPAWLYSAPETLKQAFVDGYVSANGCASGNLIETCTVSKKLAFGMRTLAVSMGNSATVYLQVDQHRIIEGKKVNAKPIYKVKWTTSIGNKHKQTHIDEEILWSPIREIVQTGRKKNFFNISVEEDESYVAEGIIVHNCKHFSKAKGGKPVEKKIRGLAWIVLKWAAMVRPRVIMLENVEEFQTWGPCIPLRDSKTKRIIVDMTKSSEYKVGIPKTRIAQPGEVIPANCQIFLPDPKRKGETYKKWHKQLERLGYQIETKELVAADYGAPTMRKRFFMVARCDGKPITFPEPTHGPKESVKVKKGILKPYVGAYTQIDFSRPCPSIFDTSSEIKEKYGIRAVRPLADNTMQRIAKGLQKFVLENPEPFIIQCNHSGERRPQNITEPLPTITGKHGYGIVQPYLIQYHSEVGEKEVRGQKVDSPLMTIDSSNRYALVTSFLKEYGIKPQKKDSSCHSRKHMKNLLVTSNLIQMNNHCDGKDILAPLPTITAGDGHFGEVRTFLIKYYGNGTGQSVSAPLDTIPTHDRFGLVTIHGVDYKIVDIGLRMLEPKELYGCQGFPEDYIIDRDFEGKKYGRTEQVKRCGNAVCPPLPAALIKANLPEMCVSKRLPICRPDRINQEETGQLRFA